MGGSEICSREVRVEIVRIISLSSSLSSGKSVRTLSTSARRYPPKIVFTSRHVQRNEGKSLSQVRTSFLAGESTGDYRSSIFLVHLKYAEL